MQRYGFAFAAAIAVLVLSGYSDAPRLVVVLIGQSNAEGRGAVADLPPDFPRHPSQISVFKTAWQPAREPLIGSRVGPGVALVDALAAANPGREIGLVPCTKGATSIVDWLPGGELYRDCTERVRAALPGATLVAAVLYQGESDTETTELASAWPKRSGELIAALRTNLDQPRLPVVMVVIGQHAPGDPRFPYWAELQEAQRAVSLDNLVRLEASPYAVGADGLHLSTAGQIDLGQAIAAMIRSSNGR